MKKGFTLIEVMIASVLSIIVVMASGHMLSGLWRIGNTFIEEELTMNEISSLSYLFRREVREKSSISSTETTDIVVFDDGFGNRSSFVYKEGARSIVYINEDGARVELLPNSVVSGFSVTPDPTTSLIEMKVTIKEKELGEENEYTISAKTR